MPRQILLATGLALVALSLREALRPLLGGQLPLLPLLAALLALPLLVQPLPVLLGAAVGAAGLLWQPPAALHEWLWFGGAALVAGAMAWGSARLFERQRRVAVDATAQCEQLHAALAQVADGVVCADAAGRVTYMNPAACRLSGWPLQDARGRHVAQVLQIVDASDAPGGVPLLVGRDGRRWPIEKGAAPPRSSSGADAARPGEVHVLRDISERRRAADERAQAARRRDEFLAALAHELRNPLAPAVNALQMLDAASADATAQARARVILRRQLRRMVRLIDDLMDVSRITHDRLVLQCEPLTLQQVVQRAVEASRHRIESAGQTLELRLAERPIGVQADAARLEQIVGNLLDNASKFSPPGSVVSLSLQRDGDEAELQVRDRGIGIAIEVLPRLFEMFTQGDASHGVAASGLGVGLALSRRLAELHGGSLHAYSAGPGFGSELVLRLPVDAALSMRLGAAAAQQQAGRAMAGSAADGGADSSHGSGAEGGMHGAQGSGAEGSEGAQGPGAGCRVLVIDDNQDAAESLSELLKLSGHPTRTAHDGRDVLGLVKVFKPQALVLDIGLPGLSGLDVARQLRRQPGGEQLLLVAVTGWGQESDRRASAEAGFDAHLVKPVDTLQLLQLLAERAPDDAP